jgi:hypothetical protein
MGEHVASGRQIESTPTRHPVLGPAVVIYSDPRRSWGSLFLDLAFVCVALLGFFLGAADLEGAGSDIGGVAVPSILGLGEIVAAFAVSGWAIRAAIAAIARIRHPGSLIVGRDGFEYLAGNGPVGWDEVESVNDPSSPAGQPRVLRVQLSDPDEYARRHRLSPIDRLSSMLNHRDLVLGHESIMPVVAMQALMRDRLAEFRGAGQSLFDVPAAAIGRRPKRRRQAPTK